MTTDLIMRVNVRTTTTFIRESTLERSVYPVTTPATVNPRSRDYPDCLAATLHAGIIYGLRARRLECEYHFVDNVISMSADISK